MEDAEAKRQNMAREYTQRIQVLLSELEKERKERIKLQEMFKKLAEKVGFEEGSDKEN